MYINKIYIVVEINIKPVNNNDNNIPNVSFLGCQKYFLNKGYCIFHKLWMICRPN